MTDSEGVTSTDAIERFPAPESPQVTTFKTDELTALCPFDFGGPDHYDLTIRYKTGAFCLESRSLKLWLESYRDQEISAEALADELYRDIRQVIDPEALYIRLEQARRGGIAETVEVGDRALR